MTPQPGRPTTGKQITPKVPERDIDRLDTLAAENGTTRNAEIRTAITNHLGPDVDPDAVAARVADIHTNAWRRSKRDHSETSRNEWGDQIAHAIWQANTIIWLHSSDWNPDLTPVWEAIATAELDPEDEHEEGPAWGDVLWAFARLVDYYSEDLGEHVLARVDCVSWALAVHTGTGPFSAPRPATFTWSVFPDRESRRNSIRAAMDMDDRTQAPDKWAVAGRLIINDLYTHTWEATPAWEVNAPMVAAAADTMRCHQVQEEAVKMVVGRWEKARWEDAEQRLGGKPSGDCGLMEWCAKTGHPTDHMDEWMSDAGKAARQAGWEAWRVHVQADLHRLDYEEYKEWEAELYAEKARRKAARAARCTSAAPYQMPVSEAETPKPATEPLEDWEREILEPGSDV